MILNENSDEKYIVLDIETANLSMEDEGLQFDNPKDWKTACVCIYDSHKHQDWYFVNYTDLDVVRRSISLDIEVHPFIVLENKLNEWFNEGYLLVTHNGYGFDNPILSKPIVDGGADCASILNNFDDSRQIDMSLTLKQITGERYRLQHLVHGLLGNDTSKLMDAAFAPVEWANGNYDKVLKYCISDCHLTLKTYLTAKKIGHFHAESSYKNYPIVKFEAFERKRLLNETSID